MKIAQIVASLESRHGGPSRSVRGLSGGLARIGHETGLLTTVPPGGVSILREGGLTIRSFTREFPQILAISSLMREHLLASDYDVIHHHGLWLRTLHYARRAAKKNSAPLVISPRGMMSPWAWNHHRGRKIFAARFLHPEALHSAAGWHATSETEASEIRALGFNRPVCIAPNGVIPPSAGEEAAAARRWFELHPSLGGRRVALFYSRLHAKKRVLELIDLWLSRSRGDWVLLIVGIPEQYTVNQLDTYIIRQGGIGRIIVHDGTHEPPPYPAASLFLLPSHSENFGLVIAEALVHGVPVLTTDGTPWQSLQACGAGHCVSWENYGPVLDKLLAASAAELVEAGGRARAWATPAFSWEKTAAILGEFYRQLHAAR